MNGPRINQIIACLCAAVVTSSPASLAQSAQTSTPSLTPEVPQQQQQPVQPAQAAPSLLQGGVQKEGSIDAPPQQAPMINQQPVYQQPPPMAPPYYQQSLQYQQQMGQPPYREPQFMNQQAQFGQRPPMSLYAQQGAPLVGGASFDRNGTPVLPVWKTQPDEIIGHFFVTVGVLGLIGIRKQVDGPPSHQVLFTKISKWRGDQHQPCHIQLVDILNGSGGYFFRCLDTRNGPRGWIYPIAKRGPEDKVTPWAIFFDQR